MKIHYKQWILINQCLSENMSYRKIAQKINILNFSVFYEIKIKLINGI